MIFQKFMCKRERLKSIDAVIAELEISANNQSKVNSLYNGFCDIIHSEMNKYIPFRSSNQRLNKK